MITPDTSDRSALEPNARLGHYEVHCLLGRGGMGSVYQAKDVRLDRLVALKVIDAADAEAKARFLREAKMCAALVHPNAVAVHDVGEAEGYAFIAMELLEGRTLADVGTAPPSSERVRWLVDTARALDAAHRVGIIHRDVKPDNVMITAHGAVKVLDFGIAVRVGQKEGGLESTAITLDGTILGTPLYMSPEQVSGEALDARSDQFSWAVTAYEVLSGASPWTHTSSVFALAADILACQPRPLGELLPDLPPEVGRVIARAMSRSPSERFDSMAVIVAALDVPAPTQSQPTTSTRLAQPETKDLALAATQAVPPPHSRLGRRRALLGAAAVAVLAAGLAARSKLADFSADGASAVGASAPPAISSAPAGAPLVPCTPEADALFREGLETWETRGLWLANDLWSKAVEVDPRCAPAYLRLALGIRVNTRPLSEVRTFYAKANENADHLSDRDRELAVAVAPYFSGLEPDDAAVYENLRALASRRAEDPLIAFFYGFAAVQLGHRDEARSAFERSIELRPAFAPAFAKLQEIARTPAERDALQMRCLEVAPRHNYCREVRFGRLVAGEDCPAVERFAQNEVNQIGDATAWTRLAEALARNGAPADAVEEALARSASAHHVGLSSMQPSDVLALAGAYDEAERRLRTASGAGLPDEIERQTWAVRLATLLDDTGRSGEADALVKKTYLSSRALSKTRDERFLGASTRFDARLWDAGIREPLESDWAPASPQDAELLPDAWVGRRLFAARTAEEARVALAGVPVLDDAANEPLGRIEFHEARLHAQLGEWKETRRDVEAALRRCDHARWGLEVPRVYFLLGQACEHTDDRVGAIAAYETIVARWSHLKPKAVLADKARARLKVLKDK